MPSKVEYLRAYYQANKPAILARRRDQRRRAYAERPELRQRVADRNRRQTQRLRVQIIAGYGGCCACCGETTPEFLTIDHIHGGGTAHFASFSTPAALHRWLVKQHFPAGFQLLCWNCNCGRERDPERICPHARQRSEAAHARA